MYRLIIVCSFAWSLFALPAHAQSITDYRYWWDDDISTNVTTSVSSGQTFSLDTDFSTAALENGHHTLTIQVKDDNGVWSVPHTSAFVQNGNLVQYEYWFDDDIASRTVQSTPESNLQEVNASIDVSSLSAGLHKISIRSLTNNGESTVPYTRFFKVSGGDLVGWEYWFDDDVSTTTQAPIAPPQSMLELIDVLDASGLSSGPHTVTWRCEDTHSNWSVPITYAFDALVGLEDIAGLESVLIFPIPAQDQLSIRIETNTQLQLDVEILNQHGQTIRAYQNGLSPMNGQLSIDVSHLAAGVYFVKLSNSEKFITHKFVKQ